jgi:hypothetical protein
LKLPVQQNGIIVAIFNQQNHRDGRFHGSSLRSKAISNGHEHLAPI